MTDAPRTSTGDVYFNTPEPVMHKTLWGDLFTATQMREYRKAALEEAARVCDEENTALWSVSGQLADAIRALKEQK